MSVKNNLPNIIGIMGRTGAGKTFIGSIFEKIGYLRIDCDEIMHKALNTNKYCINEITLNFGSVLYSNGKIDISKLKKNTLREFFDIVYQYVFDDILYSAGVYVRKKKGVILEGSYLFELGVHDICNDMIFVWASADDCMNRIIQRDFLTKEEAQTKITWQEAYITMPKPLCNYRIENSGDKDRQDIFQEVINLERIINYTFA